MTTKNTKTNSINKKMKKLKVIEENTNIKQFRLLDFNAYDTCINDNNSGSDEEKTNYDKEIEFVVQYFGINDKRETFCVFLQGYKPFFYIKIPNHWGTSELSIIKEFMKKQNYSIRKDLIDIRLVERKKLYGFDAEKKHRFAVLKFNNLKTFNQAKSLWYEEKIKNGKKIRTLKPKGLNIENEYCILYEAHIPPLLRQFHIQEISPSGWVELSTELALEHQDDDKVTRCDYEYTMNYRHLKSLLNKEDSVPYKIMSFDIEASSSHGDFPLPIKNYRKLAENILEYIDHSDTEITENDIKELIDGAFGYGRFANTHCVDKVFPKRKPSKNLIEELINKFLNYEIVNINDKNKSKTLDISDFFTSSSDFDNYNENENDIDENDIDEDVIDDVNDIIDDEDKLDNKRKTAKPKTVKTTKHKGKGGKKIVEILNNSTIPRINKLNILVKLFNPVRSDGEGGVGFPTLEGDKVTFIGSTFIYKDQEKPYLNNCIVLNTCETPEIENVEIESYKSEKEVLLAWKELVLREDPDIIIGYNIFGFDYEFMFRRACECDVAEEFLELSRNKGEMCGSYDKSTGLLDIEKSSVVIASGQHEFHFIKMNGRVQIDMLNYMRRDYNLTSYKLDSVANEFIGDGVKKIEYDDISNRTKIYSKNLIGLEKGNFISFEEIGHSTDQYKGGEKFMVVDLNEKEGIFYINGKEEPDMLKKVRWGLAKDDVSPQDIFELGNGSAKDRSIIAKYCIQDCNLVQHLVKKIDVITGFIEMANISSVPISFLVFRGQGIKLTSYLAKKCRELGFLIPTIDKGDPQDAYEGAIVLTPKVGLYNDNPVACLDYASLYPSEMIADNISHDSKVWVKTYDLEGNFISEKGEKDENGNYKYDNLPNYNYVDITYDHYKLLYVAGKKKPVKTLVGKKVCRFAQFPEGCGVLPAILKDLLAKRKETRKKGAQIAATDPFLANVLDKRQLSYKVTANSIYGQCGAKTSTFYEIDVAASTTAGGQMMLMYAKAMLEKSYINRICYVEGYGNIKTNAEYVYGDTDSVFFTFNLMETDGTPIRGKRALEITIKLAQEAGELASSFLKGPHDLEYEKTFLPFCLLSKKRYVGMLYETDPNKCYRKSMGIVLKRRDNADIVKDSYGGVIDILMKGNSIEDAVDFTKNILQDLIDKKVSMNKLIITKSLRGHYANPDQIAHKVLADRITIRDPGNKPTAGSRIAYAYIVNPESKKQGDRIETPEFIKQNNCKIDYKHYITNQIMKPLSQVFGLCIEDMYCFRRKKDRFIERLETLKSSCNDPKKLREKEQKMRDTEVKKLIFDDFINKSENIRTGQLDIRTLFQSKK